MQADVETNGSKQVEQLFTDPSAHARRVTLRPGEALFDTDSTLDQFYYIHSGELRFFQVGSDGDTRLARIMGHGEWIEATAFGGAGDFACRCVASSTSEVSVMPKTQLVERLQQKPLAAIEMLREASARLMNAYDAASRLVFDDCNERLLKALINLSDSPAATREGSIVTVRITHQQLAQAVGAARETISLALTELRHQNLLETGRNRLVFNPEALKNCTGKKSRKAPAVQVEETVAA